jgi:SAM-dependent methyltransferase
VSLRFHEIAEANHRILNPFTEDKLMLVGDICRLRPGMAQLDLACGKGEMLCRFVQKYDIRGVGVDISEVFLAAAQERAYELNLSGKVNFAHGDAAHYPQDYHEFDIVSCIGATWIGGGLVGTLELMKPALKDRSSFVLVGEPYWSEPPPPQAVTALDAQAFTSLIGTLERIESAGFELVEMVLADTDSWDRYAAAQWMAANDWLRDNPDDPDAPDFRDWIAKARRSYLEYGRRYFGWGVFVLRQSHS